MMQVVKETAGKYLSVSSYLCTSGFSAMLLKNRGDDPSKTQVYYNTPTIFKVSEHGSSESFSIEIPSTFYADDVSRDSMQVSTGGRMHLGSVVYNDGVAHHEYNGVYHAKCDGTIKFQPQIDKADSVPGKGNPLRLNPFTGAPDDRVIFVHPGTALYETASNSGWNSANTRFYQELHNIHMAGFLPVSSEVCVLYELTLQANMVSDTDPFGSDDRSVCSVQLATVPMWKFKNVSWPDTWLTSTYGFQPFNDSTSFKQWLVKKGRVKSSDFDYVSRDTAFNAFLQIADQGLLYEYLTERYRNERTQNAYAQCKYTAISANVSAEELKRQLGTLTSQVETELLNARLDRHVNWHDLAYRAYQDIGMWDGNGIQYLTDIAHLTTDTRRLLQTLRSLGGALKGKKLKAACKAASAAYLSIHYGIKLSILDTRELAKVINSPQCDFGRKRCQAAETFVAIDQTNGNRWNVSARYQLMYNTKNAMNKLFMEYLKMLDIVPNLNNIWDAIPYSFCIDWFVRVGDLLNSIDNFVNICSSYDVEAAGQSVKYTRTLSPSELGIAAGGEITFSLYTRGYSRVAVDPIPSKLTTSTNPFTHSVEAGALLVSK